MNNKDSVKKTNSEKPNMTPKDSNLTSLTPLQRFKTSMNIGFEEWHDGIGYNIPAIRLASQEELDEIEKILINHRPRDWRDIEALAEINTKRSRETIKDVIKDQNPVLRIAVIRFTPDLITDNERTQSIIYALQNTEIFSGFSNSELRYFESYAKN
ncbi:MAG: HEAT repeat domain-containing protein [Candidatus Bathyarchaeota archaeon]